VLHRDVSLASRFATALLVATAIGCAPRQHDSSAPGSAEHDRTLASLQDHVTELERRVEVLEHQRDAAATAPASSAPTIGWSCMAKCGNRNRQTTEFKVDYERVTGKGATAAEAYEDMLGHCSGTIYETIEDERFLGGEMKNVCLREGSDAAR
jgi:hypothetical protein